MTTSARVAGLILAVTFASSLPARAQSRPAPVVEAAAGWAGFLDDRVLNHGLIGVGTRVYLTPRFSLGPEVTYLAGPGSDRDLIVTGNVMFDVLAPAANRPRRVTPFLVAGGGLFRHTDTFQRGPFASTEGAFTFGVGARAWMTRRTYLGMDARLGWEPHLRLAATVGVALDPD